MSEGIRADRPGTRAISHDQAIAESSENIPLGAAYALSAFLCLAAMSAFAKAAGDYAPTIVIVFFQNLICLAIVAPVTLRHGFRPLRTHHIRLHLLRAASGTAAWFGLFLAITLIPLSNAVLLTYSAPLWMPLIGWIVTRQTISVRLWAGVMIGFLGVFLVLNPSSSQFGIGALFAIGAAILLALALMSVRWLEATEPVPRILFYYFLFSTVMLLPFAASSWGPIEGPGWPYLVAIGICLLGSQVLIALAYQQATAVKLGPLIYSVILFTALINWLIWAQPLTVPELAGMALIIVGGVTTMTRSRQAVVR
jgi:drug/metabolite transporter (DMT)-like permease